MKTKTYVIIFFLLFGKVFSQQKDIFTIKTFLKTSLEISEFKENLDSLDTNSVFYEDEKYIVYRFCKGEWGGAVIFENKKTHNKFISKSTCPVSITKFNNKYIVTNALHHLAISTEILEIADPEQLEKATIEDEKKAEYEKTPQTGTKKLIATYGYFTLFSFVYDKKLYHIVSDRDETYVAELNNGKFLKIQSIYNKSLSTIFPRIIKNKNSTIISYNDHNISCYIEIQNNTINLYTNK